jgi:hypothetical protein
MLSQGEALIANSAPVIGVENAAALRKAMRSEVTKSFIYSQIDASPGTIKSYLEEGVFDDTLNATERHKLTESANNLLKKNEKDKEQADALSNHALVRSMAVSEAKGELTLGEIDKAISQGEAGSMRQKDLDKLYSLKTRAIEEGVTREGVLYPKNDTPSAVNQITDDLGYITGFTQKGTVSKKGVKVEKGATLNRLQKSQDLLDANRDSLSRKSAERFQNIIDHGWRVYTDKNKYATKYSKLLGKTNFNMDEFNQGLVSLQSNADKAYKVGSDRQRAKAMSIQYYNKYYGSARKMQGFNQAQFIQDIVTRTRRAMENE